MSAPIHPKFSTACAMGALLQTVNAADERTHRWSVCEFTKRKFFMKLYRPAGVLLTPSLH
jgi:hypothetical protein